MAKQGKIDTDTGALPPPGAEWQSGKTAASILFVMNAEKALVAGSLAKKEAGRLRDEVEAIKRGERVLADWLTIEEFLSGTSS